MPPRPSTDFGKSLASYTAADAGHAALLAAISKAPRDYAPAPGNPRPTRPPQPDSRPDGAQRVHPRELAKRCQGEPIRVAPRSPVKTDAPAAIEHVLSELD